MVSVLIALAIALGALVIAFTGGDPGSPEEREDLGRRLGGWVNGRHIRFSECTENDTAYLLSRSGREQLREVGFLFAYCGQTRFDLTK